LDDYITAFETIAPRTGYNDKALLRFFKKGLNDPLRRRITNLDPGPDTLEEYKRAAVRIQSRWEQERIESVEFRRKPATAPTTTPVAIKAVAPATPQATSTPPTAVGKMTPEEFARCIKDKLCHRCRQPGHFAANCPVFRPST
jgi:hypothetical protein